MNKTVFSIRIPKSLWQKMEERVEEYARDNTNLFWPPLVFALYSKEDNHYEIISYREIPTVQVSGDIYKYPGIKKLGFYPRKGTGKWFSGTLVVGSGIDLDEEDKKWMIRDQMDFRIKMDRDPLGQLSWKAYYIDFPLVSLDLL